MLKDFKHSSHVMCEKNIENLTNDAMVIESLDIDPGSDDGGDEVRVKRDYGRHYAPSPMDMRDIMSPDIYHRYDIIVNYLQDISSRHSFVSLLELGRSHENRSVLGVKIGLSHLGAETPSLVVDGGMHAREWITVATALNSKMVITNGYEFSHTIDRFWRKNRRPPPEGSQCYGVDLNRNFDIGYGLGASTNPCEEVYQGPSALSEPEVVALTSLGASLDPSLLAYISLHAYGQSWLTPWGYKADPVTNMEALVEAARAAFREVECQFGKVPAREYEVGGAADIYYIAGGASDDWFYERTSAEFAYTVELPDDGRQYGFLLPSTQAPRVGDEVWAALRTLALHILANMDTQR